MSASAVLYLVDLEIRRRGWWPCLTLASQLPESFSLLEHISSPSLTSENPLAFWGNCSQALDEANSFG